MNSSVDLSLYVLYRDVCVSVCVSGVNFDVTEHLGWCLPKRWRPFISKLAKLRDTELCRLCYKQTRRGIYLCIIYLGMYVWACVCPGWISMWLSIWVDASQKGDGLSYQNWLNYVTQNCVASVINKQEGVSISVLFISGCMCERVCVRGEFRCDWAFGLMPPRKATAFHIKIG